MASCNDIVRQIRQHVDQDSLSLTGCKSVLDIETATRHFVTCIVGLGVKDHYAEIVSATMPQDYEEQKDPVGESEASLLKLLRSFKKTVFEQKQKSSAELLKAMAFKSKMEEVWAEFGIQLAANEATLTELQAKTNVAK